MRYRRRRRCDRCLGCRRARDYRLTFSVAIPVGTASPSWTGHDDRSIRPPGPAAKLENACRWFSQNVRTRPRADAGSVIEKDPDALGHVAASGLITWPPALTPTTSPLYTAPA